MKDFLSQIETRVTVKINKAAITKMMNHSKTIQALTSYHRRNKVDWKGYSRFKWQHKTETNRIETNLRILHRGKTNFHYGQRRLILVFSEYAIKNYMNRLNMIEG